MTRSVSATEAKATLSDLMKWAVRTGGDVIIQSRGYPQVVIVPYKEYEEMRELKERARRVAAIAELREIALEIQARNADLTPDEAEALADEVTRAAIDQLVEKGKIRFEE